jgi:ArsR family transcriptional regulator, arsenate/arsenite/antimonite-responsive transcriptional repressor
MNDEQANNALLVYKALSDETRLSIVYCVAYQGKCGTKDCSKGLDLSQPTLSHHIKILIEANILILEKKGTSNEYTLNSEFLDSIGIRIQPSAKKNCDSE